MSVLFVVLAVALSLSVTALAVRGAGQRKRLAALAALGVLGFAVGGYMLLGSPELTRTGATSRAVLLSRSLAKLDQHAAILRRSGVASIKDWSELAKAYWAAGRQKQSADALGEAAALAEAKQRDALLGAQAQALVSASARRVSPKARAIFADILSRQRDNLRALFFLGLAAEQAADKKAMQAYWGHLLKIAPDKGGWRKALEGRMQGTTPAATPPLSATPAAKRPAGITITSGPERDMIEAMVARLANRLHDRGGSAAEWARLGKSYSVLGRRKDALAAYDKALELAPGNAALIAARQAADAK